MFITQSQHCPSKTCPAKFTTVISSFVILCKPLPHFITCQRAPTSPTKSEINPATHLAAARSWSRSGPPSKPKQKHESDATGSVMVYPTTQARRARALENESHHTERKRVRTTFLWVPDCLPPPTPSGTDERVSLPVSVGQAPPSAAERGSSRNAPVVSTVGRRLSPRTVDDGAEDDRYNTGLMTRWPGQVHSWGWFW